MLTAPDQEEQPQRGYGECGPSIREFFDDPTFIRVLIGGRGSGKTFALAEDITAHIWSCAGAKAIVARETESSQADSSIDSFFKYFEGLGPLYSTAALGLFKSWNNGRTFRLPSRLAVERMQEECKHFTTRAELVYWIQTKGDPLCGYVEFRGLPAAEKGKFRGMECSYLALVEADQIVRRQFELSLACLRWKGSDPETCDEKGYIKDRCVVLDTNPPGPRHWIAELEAEEDAKPKSERRIRFWHIPTHENEHNLPENYIRDTILLPYASNPPMLERMLFGRYADAFEGKPVFYAYRRAEHEAENLGFPRGAYLIRGWDFGTNNAVVWSAYWIVDKVEYWYDLLEQYLEGSDTDRQAREVLKRTEDEFPFYNDRSICSGLLDFCDPAGVNSTYTRKITVNGKQVNESSINILRTHGINPGFMTTARGLQETIAIVNRLLEKRDSKDKPVYKIDVKGCPMLTRAMRGGYRYPAIGEPGYNGSNEPLKGLLAENLDHISDSTRYSKINCLKLLRAEMEGIKKPLFAGKKRNPNPSRSW